MDLAGKILEALEVRIQKQDISLAKLETGVNQDAAVNLYNSCGFKETEPLGEYSEKPLNIFMERN